MFKDLLYRKAFDRIFREHYSRLYHYALQITGEAEASRDIVSDVFTGLWNNISSVDTEKVNAYLMASVRHRCVDFLRTSVLSTQYAEEYLHCYNELYSDYSEELEKDKLVEQFLAQLPAQTRRIIELCYLHHKKYSEVAEELSISPDTVKKHVVKALKMLKECYYSYKTSE